LKYRFHLQDRKISQKPGEAFKNLILQTWEWRRNSCTKRQVLSELHVVITKKTAFRIVTGVRALNSIYIRSVLQQDWYWKEGRKVHKHAAAKA
jgi:hypothetical protein